MSGLLLCPELHIQVFTDRVLSRLIKIKIFDQGLFWTNEL
jgi:hypothetical protein